MSQSLTQAQGATVAELEAFNGAFFTDNSLGITAGKDAEFDGKGGIHHFDTSSTAIRDGFLILKPTNIDAANPGRWIRDTKYDRLYQETHEDTTDANGQIAFTFNKTFATTPNICVQLIDGANNQRVKLISRSTTGCTVHVVNEALGLVFTNAANEVVSVLITERE